MQTIKKIAVMSVALVLLCVNAMAQNEKKTNSTNSFYGVTIERTSIDLTPGEVNRVEITVMEGYDDPFMTYNGSTGKTIVGEIFFAKFMKVGSLHFLEITARDVTKEETEVIYIKSLPETEEYRLEQRTIQDSGVPLTINVSPK